jgi:hypothetical protein
MNFQDRTIVGFIEKIKIIDNDGKEKEFTARIDSGAEWSSIDINAVKDLNIGKPIGYKDIKQANGKTRRSVHKSKFIIEGKELEATFTLADRRDMKYRILIGQNILKKNFLIDPLKK